MIDMTEKLKWAVKQFLSENSKRNVLDVSKMSADIVSHAKYGKAFNSGRPIMEIAYKVAVAYFRHNWTNYDELLRKGDTNLEYRRMANDKAQIQIRRWKKGKKDLVIKDIRINA